MQDYFKLCEAQEEIKLLRMSLSQQQNAIRAALIACDEDDYDEVKELLRSVISDDEIPFEIVQNETIPAREFYMNPRIKLIG